VIVDNIIGTGSTLSAAAQTVLDEGAEARLRSRHPRPVLRRRLRILESGPLSGIVVTDTVPLRASHLTAFTQLTSADILEDSIRRSFSDDSVSEIFASENQAVLGTVDLTAGLLPLWHGADRKLCGCATRPSRTGAAAPRSRPAPRVEVTLSSALHN
jgi:hypothetical protein